MHEIEHNTNWQQNGQFQNEPVNRDHHEVEGWKEGRKTTDVIGFAEEGTAKSTIKAGNCPVGVKKCTRLNKQNKQKNKQGILQK